jgi:hypothetical protein
VSHPHNRKVASSEKRLLVASTQCEKLQTGSTVELSVQAFYAHRQKSEIPIKALISLQQHGTHPSVTYAPDSYEGDLEWRGGILKGEYEHFDGTPDKAFVACLKCIISIEPDAPKHSSLLYTISATIRGGTPLTIKNYRLEVV